MKRLAAAVAGVALLLVPAPARAEPVCSPAPVEVCVVPTLSLLHLGPFYIQLGPNGLCIAMPFGPPCPPNE